MSDNATPHSARDYDRKINATIPYYGEFYSQALDVAQQAGFAAGRWLDLGCGTGTFEKLVLDTFPGTRITAVDPADKMLAKAREKLGGNPAVEFVEASSDAIAYEAQFDVVSAIQSHHYMRADARRKAVANVFRALKAGGLFLCFENIVSEDPAIRAMELLRWGRYQVRCGKTPEEALAHNRRCGVNYFPLTVPEHIALLRECGFAHVCVFWRSYMQMGIYAIK